MKLNTHEVGSPLWQKLTDHYEPQLAKLRARAENPILTEADRLPLLWQISHIKNLLELGEPDKKKVAREAA